MSIEPTDPNPDLAAVASDGPPSRETAPPNPPPATELNAPTSLWSRLKSFSMLRDWSSRIVGPRGPRYCLLKPCRKTPPGPRCATCPH